MYLACFDNEGGGGTQQSFIREGGGPTPSPFYTTFDRKVIPFLYHLLTNGTHFEYQV